MRYDDLIGKPFKYGGRGPDEYDCYGLMMEVFRRMGVKLPDYFSTDQDDANAVQITDGVAQDWQRIAEPEVGCGVTLRLSCDHPTLTTHVGVVVDADLFLHTRAKVGVVAERLSHPVWQRKVTGFFRFAGNRLATVATDNQ
jgi:cell wall-associated NlpC family hydrolase